MQQLRFFAALVAAVVMLAPPPAPAQEPGEVDGFVAKAERTMLNFAADPGMAHFRTLLRQAKGILVVPVSIRGGFIFGASGGHAALLAHDFKSGEWSYPAFYAMGSVTFGLQAGGEVAELVMLIMSDKGLDAMLSTEVKLGGDVSVAAGPVGMGGKIETADVMAWARSKGIYAGVNVEGAVITVRDSWNAAYYGKPGIRPLQILVQRQVSNPQADPLRKIVAGIATGR